MPLFINTVTVPVITPALCTAPAEDSLIVTPVPSPANTIESEEFAVGLYVAVSPVPLKSRVSSAPAVLLLPASAVIVKVALFPVSLSPFLTVNAEPSVVLKITEFVEGSFITVKGLSARAGASAS